MRRTRWTFWKDKIVRFHFLERACCVPVQKISDEIHGKSKHLRARVRFMS